MNIQFFAGVAAGWIFGASITNSIDSYKSDRPVRAVCDLLIGLSFLGGYFAIRYL